jgi:large conductance mechanosensitive channel
VGKTIGTFASSGCVFCGRATAKLIQFHIFAKSFTSKISKCFVYSTFFVYSQAIKHNSNSEKQVIMKMKFLNEFKDFALKGNVMDMAVGVIIGGAFQKIISSVVNDIIMPPIGMLLGKTDFSNLAVTLNPKVLASGGEAVLWKYGAFIQTCLDFVILAFCVFLLVKGINMLKRKREETPAAPPTPTAEEVLLTEIRDLLAKK